MPTLVQRFSLAAVIALCGCYHATIETGATPSTVVIDKSFASSWIYGLVPPSLVSTASKCTDGVAKVETQHTFVNQLVGFLTLGIYTPMQIKVTCATHGSASAHVSPRNLSSNDLNSAAR
jgi:Bor protein